jgi:hypothetical protein
LSVPVILPGNNAAMMKALWASVMSNPVTMRRINGWATVVWFVAAFPICFFLSESVPFLVFISVYAVVTGHLSSWQAARTEVLQQQQMDQDPNYKEESE